MNAAKMKVNQALAEGISSHGKECGNIFRKMLFSL